MRLRRHPLLRTALPHHQQLSCQERYPRVVLLEFMDASETRARWCGFELEIYREAICCYRGKQWWVLRGPSPLRNEYDPSVHWLELYVG